MAMTGESPERGIRPPGCQRDSEAVPKDGHRFDADVVMYDAITPAILPLEPMIVVDARGNEVAKRRPPRARGNPQEEEGTTEPEPSVLNVEELAALLRVNRKTVYDALSRAEIPGARRIGGTYRILRDAVIDWLASSQDRVARSRRNR
jgi:excisionase family DNA binding protein